MNQASRELIARAEAQSWLRAKNGGSLMTIEFIHEVAEATKQEKKLLLAELFEELFRQKIKIKKISFCFKKQEGTKIIFTLNDCNTTLACAAKNGTLSLYLNREEVARLQALSGQTDNRSHKVAIYAFDPQNLHDLNYTIFYTDDLINCVIENN